MTHQFKNNGKGQCEADVGYAGECGCKEENEIHKHQCDHPHCSGEVLKEFGGRTLCAYSEHYKKVFNSHIPTSDNNPILSKHHPQLTPWYMRIWLWLTFHRSKFSKNNLTKPLEMHWDDECETKNKIKTGIHHLNKCAEKGKCKD